MTVVLALDVATRTGIAVGCHTGKPECWSEDLGKGKTEDERFSNVLRLAHELIQEHEPALIAVEAPIGGKTSSMFLVGLVACVRGVAYNRKIPCETVAPSSVRKHFMGKAKTSRHFRGLSHAKAKLAIKQEILDRCLLLKWDVPDLDAADAAATWDYACAKWVRGYEAKPTGGMFDAR